MIWVGRIDKSAVAGVTIFSTIFWLIEVLNEVIGTSSISLISQSYGSGDMKRTRVTIEQTVTFKALVAVVAAVIMLIILRPIIYFFTDDQEVIKAALDYGYIRAFFLPIMFSSYTVNTALRCLGDAKTPMRIMIISSILNLILDPIFMFETIPGTSIPGLNMGVFGAALATVISVVAAFLIGFWLLMSGRAKIRLTIKGLFKLNWEIDRKLLTIGLPTGVEMLMRNLSGIITLKFVSIYGVATVAAFGIGNKLSGFAFMPLVGIMMGGSAIIGQCLGAGELKRAKETARFAALVNGCVMIVISGLAIIFAKDVMRIFIKEQEVIQAGVPMISIMVPALIPAAVSMGLGTALSGAGHNIPFLVSSIAARWGAQIPLMAAAVFLFKLPVIYIWFCFVIADIVEMLVIMVSYKRGTWETKRV